MRWLAPDAILHEDEATYVMVAGDDKKAHRRNVTIGLTTPKQVGITGGLKPGDAVITRDNRASPDGSAITIAK